MNKIIPLLAFSILLLVPVGAQNAFAGAGLCIENPNPAELTLAQGESQTILKQISDCGFTMGDVVISDDSDCTSQGIDVSIQTNSISANLWEGDETITNTGGNPGTTTCELALFVLAIPGGADTAHQTIMVTTSTSVVGGEFLPIDSTALILAGAQSFSWMIPVVMSVLGVGLFVVSRKSE